ncbi:copper homeostasis protein cutC homolog [Sycon ciliatum]|uniref:copper homeostasis protein cutC homolog n=1 Tax=Sycon ciliatum TaxID=27933 RepID=UPI0020ADAAA2|eukprot:scpid89953/ scgid28951/ Copper homeostasis protein cutC homolog
MAQKTRLEVCIDSVESAMEAENGGAHRVELCSGLIEGGTTPTLGMFRQVKKVTAIDVFVIIRPRSADFCYDPMEVEVMKENICIFKEAGASGIVLGALTKEGRVDRQLTAELVALARPLPVTFHRAFDMAVDLVQALEDLVELGIERVLTSGGESTCLEGLPMLAQLVKQAANRIIVVPGGGITEKNLDRILSGCQASEFHASCRTRVKNSVMTFRNSSVKMGASLSPAEFSHKVSDASTVSRMMAIADNA